MTAEVVDSSAGYQRLPTWVIGFHGCDEKIGLDVLTDPQKHLKMSENEYDWLGSGVYFWENDCDRAMQFAQQGMDGKVTKGKIKKPFVLGAIIDLGLCCNLFDQVALKEMRRSYDALAAASEDAKIPLPQNDGKHLRRPLDRTVINLMHDIREVSGLMPYQTVRAGFSEGKELYPGTSILDKNHIQIAVRDTSCIKGYFLPRL